MVDLIMDGRIEKYMGKPKGRRTLRGPRHVRKYDVRIWTGSICYKT
jgi:hypothetical protein